MEQVRSSEARARILEVLRDGSLRPDVQEAVKILKPVEECWQPSDFLPDPCAPNWFDEVKSIRSQAAGISDEVLVVLAGNMITEEALPSYQTWLNRFDAYKDETGADDNLWGHWTRNWTAEENRHGDLLNRYLYLSGRVNVRAIEVTIQHLLRNGFDPQTQNHPYKGFIYTAFQERATRISHGNTALLAKRDGDVTLQKICAAIAADEARHEKVYKEFCTILFQVHPDEAMRSFAEMMGKMIIMPAGRMDDGVAPKLFEQFATIAQRIGVYTAHDYADIFDHLIETWKVKEVQGLTGEAAKAQDFLGGLVERYRKLADRARDRLSRQSQKHAFSWIFSREI